jgi:hypothetical protein
MSPRSRSRSNLNAICTRLVPISIVLSLACRSEDLSTRVLALQPPDARSEEEFSRVTSVVELTDGSVLVTDSKDELVLRFEPGLSSSVSLGRRGSGPLEFVHASPLTLVAADSAWQLDLASQRLLVFTGVGPVAQPEWPEAWGLLHTFHGADTLGAALLSYSPRGGPGEQSDSIRIILVERSTGVGDTVAKLRPDRPWQPGKSNRAYPDDLEQAHISPDGWIAVVRFHPVRVDWRSPDGTWLVGKPLGIPDIEVNDAEREFYLKHSGATTSPPGWLQTIDWPERASPIPFQLYPTMAPNGWVVLRRRASTKWPDGIHDIVDRDGRLVAQLQLQPEQKIVGYGKASVYVVTTDEDGLQRLSRHPWPPAAP